MVLTIYGNAQSTCTLRVATVLHEKQVPFKFVNLDLKTGETKTPEHLVRQPFGKVPVLDDDGFLVYESRAIARYIEEKYAGQGTQGLIPTGLKAKALFEQAASIEQSNWEVYASTIVIEVVFKPMFGHAPNSDVVKSNIKTLEEKLDVYEKILAKQKYLAGDEITLADLFHIPWGVLLPAAGTTAVQDRPNVSRWFQNLVDRPSWQAVKDGVVSI